MNPQITSHVSAQILAQIQPQNAVEGPTLDADYSAYYARVLANGSDLSGTEKTAVQTYIAALKSNSLWDDITYLHLHIGNDHLAAKTYLKGGFDLVSAGTNNFLQSSHYAREVGFHRNAGYSYETKGTFGNGATFDWIQSPAYPMTRVLWGRNEGVLDPIGLHTHNNNGNYSLYFQGSAYGYGIRLKARNNSPSNQEANLGGGGQNTWLAGAASYDGTQNFIFRARNASGTASGTTLSLSSAHEDTTGPWQIHMANPVLGFCVCEDVQWDATQMDTFTSLLYSLHSDLGLTFTAVAPW